MSIYRRALAYYRPFIGRSVAATGLILLLIPFNLLKPVPLLILINALAAKVATSTPETTAPAAMFFGRNLAEYVTDYPLATLILALCAGSVIIT